MIENPRPDVARATIPAGHPLTLWTIEEAAARCGGSSRAGVALDVGAAVMTERELIAALVALGWREQQRPLLVVDDGLTSTQLRTVLIAPVGVRT